MTPRPAYPAIAARPEPVEFGGGAVRYVDPFRWLEEDGDPEVAAWQTAQDELAGGYASGLPGYARFAARLEAMSAVEDVSLPVFNGGRYIRTFVPEGQNLAVVEISETPAGSGRRVVDMNTMPSDEPLQLSGYSVSNNGKLAIFSYTVGGRETPVVQLVEVETARVISQGLPNERPGGFTWLPDDSGFLYISTDPADIAANRTVFRVMLDNPNHAVAEDVAPSHFFALPVTAADGRHLILLVNHLAPRPEFILDTQGDGTWRPFLKDVPGIFRGDIVGDNFFAITDDVASRGRLVSIPLATPTDRDSWKEIIPPSDAVLASLIAVGDRAVVLDYVDTYSRLRVFDKHGVLEGEIALPGKGVVNSMSSFYSMFNMMNPMRRGAGEQVDFLFATPTESFAFYSANARTRELTQVTEPRHRLDAQVLDCKAKSEDGAEVLYHVVARSDLDLAQPRPTVITGYGGFNIAVLPGWLGDMWAAWIEAGGVLVLSHLRGGGEFGSAWWDQGRLANKQNSFNDVFATAEDLIARGITTPAQLGVLGGSNGGVMAAAVAVQRPDLFRASVPQVPISDVLGRVRDPVTMSATLDYGDPADPAMAAVIHAWSPYQNVRDGVAYPSMLIDCGANDPRCPPWHSRKLAARMQQADTGDQPILLRVRAGAGHGTVGKKDQIRQSAEVLAFLSDRLGLA